MSWVHVMSAEWGVFLPDRNRKGSVALMQQGTRRSEGRTVLLKNEEEEEVAGGQHTGGGQSSAQIKRFRTVPLFVFFLK